MLIAFDIETYHPLFSTSYMIEPVTNSIAEQARLDGINLLYNFDREDTSGGGYTIAYRPALGYVGRNSGKMVDVAVAYCSRGDVFSKKIGREAAIRNFNQGNTICVPALIGGEEGIHRFLRTMFNLV